MGLSNWLRRSGPSGFGSSSTAEEVTVGIDASHLTAIVTGATGGIGKETVRVLALRGAKVVIPCRTLESGMKVKESLPPNANIQVLEMDLSSLDSVYSFVCAFLSSNNHLNILINNAGIFACPFQLSMDGIELQFATNHLGHFLLTNLLLDKMKATAKETGIQGRIINVSSIAYTLTSDKSWCNLDKINDQSRYNPYYSYIFSKLANILHANELSRRLKEEGSNVTANSLHPGVIDTDIGQYVNSAVVRIVKTLAKPILKSLSQGAATNCYVALHPDIADVTGKYFENCNVATLSTATARDEDFGRKLWELSEELIKKHKRTL